jgi:CHASE3 domain sensor protein
VFNTARQVGFTLGLAILVAVFIAALPARVTSAQEQAATLVEGSDLPAPVKQGIIEGIASTRAEDLEEAVRSGTKPTFDLYDRVRQTAGPELADALRPTLDELSQELQAVFARSTAKAFDRAFLVAAIFVWVGVLPAFLLRRAAAVEPGAASRKPRSAMG